VRLALISDTHMPRGDRRLPARCVEEIEAADLLLHAGDFFSEEVLDELSQIGPRVVAVHGNVDSVELRDRLPERTSMTLEGVTVAMLHDGGPAKGRLKRLRKWFPDADAVVFGHSHMPVHEQSEGFQIFNPGSPTERRRAPAHTMGIGEIAGGRLELRLIDL
jgi:putative phosphoesterase